MAGKEITLEPQFIYGDAPWTERAGEKLREVASKWGPTPDEIRARDAAARKHFEDMATPGGMGAKVAAHLLGPITAAPSSRLGSAVVGGASGALNGYASEGTPEAALKGGAIGAVTGAAAARLFGGGTKAPAPARVAEPAIVPAEPTALKGSWDMSKVEQVLGNNVARSTIKGKANPVAEKALERIAASKELVRDPANMLRVNQAGKEMMKKLTPAEAEARRRWVHTNSSEIQAADAAGQVTGEYGQLAQTLKSMAAKHPSPPATLYRGAHLPQEMVDEMAKSGRTSTARMESWSTNPETSQAFARGKNIPGKVPVIFRQHNGSGLALNPLESEVLIPHAQNYTVSSVTTAPDGTRIVDVVLNAAKGKK